MIILGDFSYTLLRLVAVAVMLLAMIVLLLGINRLFHNDLNIDNSETNKFKKEVKESDEVITPHSVFHDFITKDKDRGRYVSVSRLEKKRVRKETKD